MRHRILAADGEDIDAVDEEEEADVVSSEGGGGCNDLTNCIATRRIASFAGGLSGWKNVARLCSMQHLKGPADRMIACPRGCIHVAPPSPPDGTVRVTKSRKCAPIRRLSEGR